jgi:double-strand break repair protein MRE11
METLKRYCHGSNPIPFEVVSDQAINFPSSGNGCVNYEDANVNIGLPVFSIHGNHDDPSGFGGKSPLDLLSSAKHNKAQLEFVTHNLYANARRTLASI